MTILNLVHEIEGEALEEFIQQSHYYPDTKTR